MTKKNWRSSATKKIAGEINIPGDKSISHRAIMFASLAEGISNVSGFLQGEDCIATMNAFQKMGIKIEDLGAGNLKIHGKGLYGLQASEEALDLGNSGTSMRLMAGILAAQDFTSTLIGDESLSKRPMNRVITPLTLMGAKIESNDGRAPLKITGSALNAINYDLPVASAQLKSAILLAGLYADGETIIKENAITRNHTERMLSAFGVQITQENNLLKIKGKQKLSACDVQVPADISSAAFFIVAGLLAQEGELLLKNIGINPTRAAIIDILQAMGGKIEILNTHISGGEEIADLKIYPSKLQGIDIPEHFVSIAIDEFPIIFIAAACADGITRAKNLHELRVKESDRLGIMAQNLSNLGVKLNLQNDDIEIFGDSNFNFHSGEIDSHGDHRIAMSFAVAGIRCHDGIDILNCNNVATSFPNFFALATQVGFKLQEALL